MGEAGWAWLEAALARLDGGVSNLIFVSSVPLATSHFSLLDPLLTGFPSFIARLLPKKVNPKQFADDIHDQWRVPAHRDEWYRLLDALLNVAGRAGMKVTVLSGEIHLGARSSITRGDARIVQYISSGIAHKPAPAGVAAACELLSKGTQDLDGDIDIRMEYFFPEGKRRYLRARNWLSLDIRPAQPNRAVWHAENMPPVTHER